jgi:uncharacterized protein YxjI
MFKKIYIKTIQFLRDNFEFKTELQLFAKGNILNFSINLKSKNNYGSN